MIFNNGLEVLFNGIMAAIVAQVLKLIGYLIIHKKFNFKILTTTGGMPSSHSATVLGLMTAAVIKYGIASPYVAICGVLAAIVIIDATGVRYETGKQSKMLNKIVQEIFTDSENAEMHFKEFIGHTPFQVVVGSLLGVAVGIAMSFVFGETIL